MLICLLNIVLIGVDNIASTAQSLANMQASYNAGTAAMVGNVNNNINQALGVANYNTGMNAALAADQRSWSAQQAELTRRFNAVEAQKNRDWQEYMSNTAHQREVADLRAAGLNPVLSAVGGQGAAVGSGAAASAANPTGSSAQADTSGVGAIVSLLSNSLEAMSNLAGMATSGLSNLAVADKNAAASQLVAQIAANASMYGADKNYASALGVQASKNQQERYMAQNYPNGVSESIASILNGTSQVFAGDSTFWSYLRNFPGYLGDAAKLLLDKSKGFFDKLYG